MIFHSISENKDLAEKEYNSRIDFSNGFKSKTLKSQKINIC